MRFMSMRMAVQKWRAKTTAHSAVSTGATREA